MKAPTMGRAMVWRLSISRKGPIGRVCRDWSATAVIWEFFRTRPKP